MNPRDLIRIARQLASGVMGGNRGRPRQAELRRAVSTAYYALFHTLAFSGANTLAGSSRASRNQPAWRQAYRALEHGHARNQCLNRPAMNMFGAEIRHFGQLFVFLQSQRHSADYDPYARFSRPNVMRLIETTGEAIARFENAAAADRRSFAIHVLLRLRRD